MQTNNLAQITWSTTVKLRIKKRIKLYLKYKLLFFLLIPGFAALIIFQYVPMYGIIIAFKDYKLTTGIFGSEWVGLRNFHYFFIKADVWRAVRNSFIISLFSFAVSFPAVIIFSLMLNELRHRIFKRTVQTISYLPYFLSWVVVSSIIFESLSPSRGIVNYLITLLGYKPIHFMVVPQYFRTIVVLSGLWKGIGWSSVIYLAAISNVDLELYDAAHVDGAGRLKMARHITLPAMYPMISITLIFSISGLMGGDFEQIYNLMTSQTVEVGQVLSTYIYYMGIQQFDYSFSTAVGLLNTLVAITLLTIANYIARRFSEYTLW